MDTLKAKTLLFKKELTVAQISRELRADAATRGERVPTQRSLETMVADLIYGRHFYPSLAEKLNSRYGFEFVRPKRQRRRILKANSAADLP